MKIQKAAFIAFPASDFEASKHFYGTLLQLSLIVEGEDGGMPYAHYDCGGFGIHVYEWTKPFNRAHSGLQVYVEDVDSLHAELRSHGVKFSGEIRNEPWGGRVVTVSDPDGNLFDLLNDDYEEQLKG